MLGMTRQINSGFTFTESASSTRTSGSPGSTAKRTRASKPAREVVSPLQICMASRHPIEAGPHRW